MNSMHEIYNVLLFEFPYFKKINEEKRILLCNRTKKFIEGTDFIPKKNLDLSKRMIILIAACSQQLTLGFKKHYGYDYFDKIIIYPEKYFSTITQKMHTGEMNTAGVIVLSWEDFYKGMSIDDNAQNVGLHEFAHALEFMDIANKEVDEIYSACLDKFITIGRHYLKNNADKIFFRNYASTNMSEFLAVATEYYFEKPKDFFKQEPELFEALDRVYQQNILSRNLKRANNTSVKKIIDNKVIVGSRSIFQPILKQILPLILLNGLFGHLAYQEPFVGGSFLFLGNYLIYRYLMNSTFILYSNYVEIQHAILIRLFNEIFPNILKLPTVVNYADVLYISVQETNNTKFNLYEMKNDQIYSYSLCYWYQCKIAYARISTSNQNLNAVFNFLNIEKKVATRFGGDLVKF
jgi:Mlc titration factor MtfA (ptsG expression regulator)